MRSSDIRIGETTFIKNSVPSVRSKNDAIQLDPVLKPILPFIDSLEVECVAECCGLDAFRFTPNNLRVATTNFGGHNVVPKLQQIKLIIEETEAGIFVSRRINCYFQKPALLQLFNHMIQCACNVENGG